MYLDEAEADEDDLKECLSPTFRRNPEEEMSSSSSSPPQIDLDLLDVLDGIDQEASLSDLVGDKGSSSNELLSIAEWLLATNCLTLLLLLAFSILTLGFGGGSGDDKMPSETSLGPALVSSSSSLVLDEMVELHSEAAVMLESGRSPLFTSAIDDVWTSDLVFLADLNPPWLDL
jgi:hypothetical protein